MKPLHVALIVKNTPAALARDDRNMGLFSYEVPEFTWQHHVLGKGKAIDTRDFKRGGYDLIFVEDGGSYPDFVGHALPNIFYSIDSTLSFENHFAPRFEQARKADLVLVDHDELSHFEACGKPVRRLSYCANDRLFHPAEKTLDVAFHCGGSIERGDMRAYLHGFCLARGLSYASGAVPLDLYAANLNRAKVVVNMPRTPANRPHRVFDSLSSGAALVTLPLPAVSGEIRRANQHYLECPSEELAEKAAMLVENGTWQILALEGRKLIEQRHSWAVRARELRQMLSQELGL